MVFLKQVLGKFSKGTSIARDDNSLTIINPGGDLTEFIT